jgi:hypothetical protein
MRDNLSNGLLHGYISSFLCRFITLSCIISNDSLFSGREKERGETEGKSKMNPAGLALRGGEASGERPSSIGMFGASTTFSILIWEGAP